MSDAKPRASLVIPTYNGAPRIGDVLTALTAQNAAPGSFEVIVVDNNSTDSTADVARTHAATKQLSEAGFEVRVVPEARQGLTFARICGVLAARAEYVCFLDDDTVPDPGYVREGLSALDADPRIGVLVSRLRPRYAAAVPPSVGRRQHLFAINEKLGERPVEFGARATMAPTLGAGLWVRRHVFLSEVPWQTPERMLPDRIGNKLVSGNDIEIGYLVGRAGYNRVYRPGLGLEHRIPPGRLETRYVVRLIDGIVRSAITLDDRYAVRRYTRRRRLAAAGGLTGALLAAPLLLLRKDGLREALFVLASRWATLRGPFRTEG